MNRIAADLEVTLNEQNGRLVRIQRDLTGYRQLSRRIESLEARLRGRTNRREDSPMPRQVIQTQGSGSSTDPYRLVEIENPLIPIEGRNGRDGEAPNPRPARRLAIERGSSEERDERAVRHGVITRERVERANERRVASGSNLIPVGRAQNEDEPPPPYTR